MLVVDFLRSYRSVIKDRNGLQTTFRWLHQWSMQYSHLWFSLSFSLFSTIQTSPRMITYIVHFTQHNTEMFLLTNKAFFSLSFPQITSKKGGFGYTLEKYSQVLVNDHLWTTTASQQRPLFLGSRGRSLNSSLTVIRPR